MKIGILGAGNVGTTLGRGLAGAGHEIIYASRQPQSEKAQTLREQGAQVALAAEVVQGADVLILATPWSAAQAVIESAGDFGGKPLLDATNPIGPGFTLTHGHNDSGAEQVQRWAPSAKVAKVFNTTGVENMANPAYPAEHRAAMFVCADDEGACQAGLKLAADLGFEAVNAGDLTKARLLEPTALLWINLAIIQKQGRNMAFGLLRRS